MARIRHCCLVIVCSRGFSFFLLHRSDISLACFLMVMPYFLLVISGEDNVLSDCRWRGSAPHKWSFTYLIMFWCATVCSLRHTETDSE